MPFLSFFKNKKVLITGHTGFKGSWLTLWLLKLGAEVVGVSKDIPTNPSMFGDLELECEIDNYFCDLRDLDDFSKIVLREKPDMIFHLAAQPIVSVSYDDPVETITSNVVGTMNLMETLRLVDWPCAAVLITSDKSYDNVEWVWGYKETDAVGGKDIYSGSKGAAELIIKSYYHSFFANKNQSVRLAVGRAGNVIGGGDWARDRIVVDAVKAWASDRSVELRCPAATRPWQHVLEPLSGYLTLGMKLLNNDKFDGEAFNFGPRAEQNRSVADLISSMSVYWKLPRQNSAYVITDELPFKEAGLLKLNCDKALFYLQWESNLHYDEAIQFVGDWYVSFYHGQADMYALTLQQIGDYESIAFENKRTWAQC